MVAYLKSHFYSLQTVYAKMMVKNNSFKKLKCVAVIGVVFLSYKFFQWWKNFKLYDFFLGFVFLVFWSLVILVVVSIVVDEVADKF